MNHIVGWISTSLNESASHSLLRDISGEYRSGNNYRRHCSEKISCAAPEPHFAESHGVLALYSGRLYFGDKSRKASDQSDNLALEIVRAYANDGEEFVQRISGTFSIILIDKKQEKVILILDRIGKANLYYSTPGNGLVFGTNLKDVLRHPNVADDISNQSIFDYIYFHHCPSPETIYSSCRKLEGGQMVIFANGDIRTKYYWVPIFSETLSSSVEDAKEELVESLYAAVERVAKSADSTGAFLSGGLDSSTVSGILSKIYPNEAKTFSIGFPVDGYDETEFARTAVNHFKTVQHEYYLGPQDALSGVGEIADYYDEPFGNSSALPVLYCARLAKDNGVDLLLAGDGGDELFAGNERYLKQQLFQRFYLIPKLLRTPIETLVQNTPEILLKFKLFHKAKRYIQQAVVPLPDRLQDYNFLHRHRGNEVFDAQFIETIDTEAPIRSLRNTYNLPEDASYLNRMLFMDWKTTLHDNDLVKVNRMCELADVDVAYPLLDDEVVDISTRIPSSLKLEKGELRYFYKYALGDFLPEKILNKSKHGFGLPFGHWLENYEQLKELAYDSIGSLKNRHYFNPEFLDHSIEMHKSIHAPYYGELIWILMMLELWFRNRK